MSIPLWLKKDTRYRYPAPQRREMAPVTRAVPSCLAACRGGFDFFDFCLLQSRR